MSDIDLLAASTPFSNTDPINAEVNNIAVPGPLRPLSPSEEDSLSLDPLLLASPFILIRPRYRRVCLKRHSLLPLLTQWEADIITNQISLT